MVALEVARAEGCDDIREEGDAARVHGVRDRQLHVETYLVGGLGHVLLALGEQRADALEHPVRDEGDHLGLGV